MKEDQPHLDTVICKEGDQESKEDQDLFCLPSAFGCYSLATIIAVITVFILLDLCVCTFCCCYCRNSKKRSRPTFEVMPMNEEEEQCYPDGMDPNLQTLTDAGLSEDLDTLQPLTGNRLSENLDTPQPPPYKYLYPNAPNKSIQKYTDL